MEKSELRLWKQYFTREERTPETRYSEGVNPGPQPRPADLAMVHVT